MIQADVRLPNRQRQPSETEAGSVGGADDAPRNGDEVGVVQRSGV